MALSEMRYCSVLLSTMLSVALLWFIDVEPSLAMQFKTASQTVSGILPGQGFSPNDTARALPFDWVGHSKSPEKSGHGNAGTSDDFFDDQSPKPRGGFGVIGDMVYMPPLFTLMDRLAALTSSVPITKWPLGSESEDPNRPGGTQSSGTENKPQSGSTPSHDPVDSAAQRKDEKTPPEGNEEHIHIWEGDKCPILGCNNNPCCCSTCEGMRRASFEHRVQLKKDWEALFKKSSPEGSSIPTNPEGVAEVLIAGKTEQTQEVIDLIPNYPAREEINIRPNYPTDASADTDYTLLDFESRPAQSESLAKKASDSQALLQAGAHIQPITFSWGKISGELSVLSSTRFIEWMEWRDYFAIWTEGQSGWSSFKLKMSICLYFALRRISHTRFVTWASSGSIKVWTETQQGEWTNTELLNQAGFPDILTVLSDGQIVAVHKTHLSVWTEVDGVWSSVELEKDPGFMSLVRALPESGFLTRSYDRPYDTVRLWKKGEEGWTNGIYFQTTGKRRANDAVRGMDGYEIDDVLVSDGSIWLSIYSLGSCVTESGEEVGHCSFIQTSRSKRWFEFSRWNPPGSYPDPYRVLTSGQMMSWKKDDTNPKISWGSTWAEQSDGTWLSSEAVQSGSRAVAPLKDGRLISISSSGRIGTRSDSPPENVRLKVSIKDEGGWSSVEFGDPIDHPYRMFEIRPGLLATCHIDENKNRSIKLWDLYNLSQSNSGQEASQ